MKKEEKREFSEKGIRQFDEEDIIWEEPKVTLYEVPELNTNGVLYTDLKGFGGRYMIGTDGYIYEITLHEGTGRREYKVVRPFVKCFRKSAGDANNYLVITLIRPNGKEVTDEVGSYIAKHFIKKPIAVVWKASKWGLLYDETFWIPEGMLRVCYKDAVGTVANIDTVSYATPSDIQFDSMANNRNKPPCEREAIPVIAFKVKDNSVYGVYPSKSALGKASKHPRNKAGMISNDTRLRRTKPIIMADGTEVYVREFDKVSEDVQRIAINKQYSYGRCLF